MNCVIIKTNETNGCRSKCMNNIASTEEEKSCMATDMHTDSNHHHGNPNSLLYSNSFTRTFWISNRIGKEERGEICNHRHSGSVSEKSVCLSLGLWPRWQALVLEGPRMQLWIVCLEGAQTRGFSQGHNEISPSLHPSVATSRRDNNAFNFGLPSILWLCIRSVAEDWLLAHIGCSSESSSITREEEEEGRSVGVDDSSVNYRIVLPWWTDNWAPNQNWRFSPSTSDAPHVLENLCHDGEGVFLTLACMRKERQKCKSSALG